MGKAAVLKFDTIDGVSVVVIHFNFDRALIDALKQLKIGARWVPTRKHWHALESHTERIIDLLDDLGYEVGFDLADFSGTEPSVAEDWIDAAFRSTPPAQARRLYRALAAGLHPDVGGDPHLMVALNRSWSELGERIS